MKKIKSFFRIIWEDIKETFAPKNLPWAVTSSCTVLSAFGLFMAIWVLILLG